MHRQFVPPYNLESSRSILPMCVCSCRFQVSCGGTHSVALTLDGRMYSVRTYHRNLFSVVLENHSSVWMWKQFGRGDHGRLGYGKKVTTGHPTTVPINLPPRKDLGDSDGRWSAKLVACGGRHTLAIATWVDEPNQPCSSWNFSKFELGEKTNILYE